uniref:Uncharacterized protein n=1 Tax=Arundo donax TaxID=35708 RepID=A0A0A9CSB5_ARUDO
MTLKHIQQIKYQTTGCAR